MRIKRFTMEEEMASIDSNGGTNVMVEASGSNSIRCQIHASERSRPDNNISVTKFNGVVPQQNVRWGARIYCNQKWIWLGTFKTERDAVMAYDSANMKLQSADCHRNFPLTNLNIQESDFQSSYCTDAVLNMIKGGTNLSNFDDFLKSCSRSGKTEVGLNVVKMQENGRFSCQEDFRKRLRPSDVDKNSSRLVLPKKDAVVHFPLISDIAEKDMRKGMVNDLKLVFYDRFMKLWKFRYSYWNSTRCLVFTRGWYQFVREKNLKANDIVKFYTCQYKEGEKKGQTFCMIDVVYDRDRNNFPSFRGVNQYARMPVALRSNLGQNVESDKAKELEDKQLVGVEATSNTAKSGIKLFGVQIG